jgi:ribosomal protein L11 methyltransferase
MQKNYVEASIRADVDSGEILALMECEESLGAWEKDGILHFYWSEEKWNDAILKHLKRALSALGVETDDSCIAIQTVPDRDWNAAWALSLQPIRLGKHICVRQSWNEVDPGFKGIELIIDPKRAFGTGYHATTQLVIEWLEEHIRGGERILDVGTGSGILAMVAIRLGARSALAIDNDPVAVECAQEYAAVNGFGSELELNVATFENFDPGRFDVIVANLDGRTMPLLCGLIPRLLNADGIACLSGLQQQDFQEISGDLAKVELQITARTQRDEWLALEVKAKNLRHGAAENTKVHGEK